MEQEKIGKFIQTLRKEKNLTQAELAEKLNITDRAVSKWERGKSMPDSSIMLKLCEILGISVNELLMGEKIKEEEIRKVTDINLVKSLTVVEKNRKKYRIITGIVLGLLIIGIVLFGCYIYVWNGVIRLEYADQLLLNYVKDGKFISIDMRGDNLSQREVVDKGDTVYIFRNSGDYVSNYLRDIQIYYYNIGMVNLHGYRYSIGDYPAGYEEFVPMLSSIQEYDLQEELHLGDRKLKVYYVDDFKYMKKVQNASDEEFQNILDNSHLMFEYN